MAKKDKKGELYYKSSLDDFRKRALWTVYRLYNWLRLFSVIGFVLFAGLATLVVQVPAASGPVATSLAVGIGFGLGLSIAFGVAAFWTRRRGRKLESRSEEFKRRRPYPQWKAGKFGRG